MGSSAKKEWYLYILAQLGIAICLFYFFIKACPLVAFDVDDWITMGNFRLPVPIWKGAEAARVMPEVLMPVAGWIAARVIYPVCGDYTYSVTVISAVILTFLIITMCICLQKIFWLYVFRLASNIAVALEIMFLVLFFLIFRNRGTSQCMFTAADLCCIYFYTISGILNAIIVLIFMWSDDVTEMFLGWIKKVSFLLLLYFSLCLKQFIRRNAICLAILITWGIALIFDANGGRADTVGMDMSLDLNLSVR